MKLYKYRSFDSHWRDIVQESRLYFSQPSQLNDPYECKPLVVAGSTSEDRVRYAEYLARQYGAGLDPSTRARLTRETIERLESAEQRESMYHGLVAGRYGIHSFSATPDHLLLWAHYSDSHRGFCFEFEVEDEEVDAVVYRPERPVVDLVQAQTDDPDILHSLLRMGLLTKSTDWAYEQEFRALRHQGPGPVPFSPSTLTAVLLGARIPSENKALLLGLLDSREPRPRILQASLERERFALRFDELQKAA